MKIIKVSDFTKFPGPRYKSIGPYSGEEFREDVLIPAMNKYSEVSVNLDNVFGYGSSFLEEAFGGLVRSDVDFVKVEFLMNHIISNDDPSLRDEIIEYITDELSNTL